jgi:NAD(P)-dependent dehydrogenase (short-subunit alcohol dehydrogenase family)
MKKIFNLKDKSFLIAGSNGLIGRTLVSELIKHNANVIALDANEESIALQQDDYRHNPNYVGIVTDITELSSINKAIKDALSRFNVIDGAVNLSYPKNKNYGKDFFDVSYEDFCENVSLHLGAYFLFMQKCSEYSLQNNREFSLINFSSIYGVIAPKFNIYKDTEMTVPVEYAAIKSGVQHISKYLSSYTKGSKFRVNCVSPGGILDNQDPKFLKKYNDNSRSKGMLDVDDVIGTVLYLLCSEASKYVVGQNIIIDDGFSL